MLDSLEGGHTGHLFRNILYEVGSELALITINREQDQNRLSRETLEELLQAFNLVKQEEARLLLITASGKDYFSAGADLGELNLLTPESGKEYAELGQQVTAKLESLGKASIAVINGDCYSTGLELALACSIRIAVDDCKFLFPETKLGLVAPFGGVRRLARIIGVGRAAEMFLTGEAVLATEAARIGLVNRVVSRAELSAVAREVAQKISPNAPLAIKYCLESLTIGLDLPLEDANFLQSTLFGLCCASKDKEEALKALLERRKPVFQGE
ncbi:MAG: enoyl-CoA hydratase/isomerase family protein [Blastocatellia bacterium]|nr:enoyl-CoA hydratase/isomerase family protein [Blastocatellia bacterium]